MDPQDQQHENPFGASHYADPAQAAPAVGLARTFGTLNIVFGVLLVLCGMVFGFYMLIFATLMPAIGEQISADMQKQREHKIARLQEQIGEAESPEDKEDLTKKLHEAEGKEEPDVPDFGKLFGAGDPMMVAWFLSEIISGFVLNVALFISGIGLVSLKPWGRSMAQWVNLAKIARLVLFYLILANVWFVPMQREHVLEAARRAGPNAAARAAEAAAGIGTFITTASIGLLVLGAIYPLLALSLLSRANVKAAFEPDGSDLAPDGGDLAAGV